jgi:regulation of enolase protein 1 (concanavalin A-like superfamily)
VRRRGPFTAQVQVRGRFEALYDQAGLMLRADERAWLKTGVEFTDGKLHFSTVVTEGRSDWSVSDFNGAEQAFWLRLTYAAGAVRVQASLDGERWPLLRLAPFPEGTEIAVGPMCCSPERGGLEVEFRDFTVGPASTAGLHDLG